MMRRLRPNYHIKDEPQGEEEVEEEPQGPEQEQPPQNIYTTYEDMYALGENINNMYNTANALRDTTANLTSDFANWTTRWNFPPQ